jgi:hypothetical protein
MFLSAALQGLVPPCARTARAMGVTPRPWRTIWHRPPRLCFSQRRPADGRRADIGWAADRIAAHFAVRRTHAPPDLNSSEALS